MKKILFLLGSIVIFSACSKDQVNESLSEEGKKISHIDNYMESIEDLRSTEPLNTKTNAGDMKWFFPNDDIAGSVANASENGKIVLPDKRTLKWILHYNNTENKPIAFGVIVTDANSKNILSNAKTPPLEFFIGVYDCLKEEDKNLRGCITNLLHTAVTDCQTHQNCVHCWWLPC